jgi:hypothetical protein
MFNLAITYTPDGGRPLSIAFISDRLLLRSAAAAAVREAEGKAQSLMAHDHVLGMVQAEEAAKLRRVLDALMSPAYDHPAVM